MDPITSTNAISFTILMSSGDNAADAFIAVWYHLASWLEFGLTVLFWVRWLRLPEKG